MTNSPSTRPTRTARNRGVERNVRKRQRGRCGIDADHVRIVFLVGGEDQRDDLGLVAEPVREHGADGTINLTRSQDFFLAGTAFALDEAAGDASAGIGVFAVIDRQREEIDAFPRVRRRDCGCQNDGFAGCDQSRAGRLLGHAPGLKDQPLAAGKLDGYFMLRRHRVLFSFFAWETCAGRRAETAQMARDRAGCRKRTSTDARREEPLALRHKARAQPTTLRKPWQRFEFARYTMAPGSGWNGGRDQFPVWALPVQCWLSDYLRIPSLPMTSR